MTGTARTHPSGLANRGKDALFNTPFIGDAIVAKSKIPAFHFYLVSVPDHDPAIIEALNPLHAYRQVHYHIFPHTPKPELGPPGDWDIKPLTVAEAVGMVATRMLDCSTSLSVLFE